MPRDIEIVIEHIRAIHPDVKVERLKVSHPGVDDDGLWYFELAGHRKSIQVESSTGAAPFIVEHSDMMQSSDSVSGASVDQVVREVAAYLTVLKKEKANQPAPGQRP